VVGHDDIFNAADGTRADNSAGGVDDVSQLPGSRFGTKLPLALVVAVATTSPVLTLRTRAEWPPSG